MDAPFWDQMGRLTFVYSLMHSTFIEFNKMFNYLPIVAIKDSMVNVFSTGGFTKMLQSLWRNFTADMAIAQAMAGKTCEQVGASIGLMVRQATTIHMTSSEAESTGYYVRPPPPSANGTITNSTSTNTTNSTQ